MTEAAKPNLDDYQLDLSFPLKIVMDGVKEVTEEDIDSELFVILLNTNEKSGMNSISDLDDAWVKKNYPGLSGIEELRANLRRQLEQESVYSTQNEKLQMISNLLAEGLRGDIPQDLLEANMGVIRERREEAALELGKPLGQYLMEEGISQEDFLADVLEETRHEVSIGIALDKYIQMEGIEVAEEEVPDFFQTGDREAFMREIRANNEVDQAREAAARIKAMRKLLEETELVGS